ncbi:MAG: SDR family oxidoreductase [Clostridia bacterium]|nr:SDR family oxidoreductase [Clostridia bacterium]
MNNGRVVIVSGGSRGLGKAIVQSLLNHNFIVAAFSRSETDFIKQLKENEEHKDNFYWEPIDAKDYNSLKVFVSNLYKKYGGIAGLVNNAGASLEQLLPLTNEDNIDEILSLNLGSVINLTRYVSRVMLLKNEGVVINISSIVGLRGFKGTSVYGASKAALDGFTRSLARELGSKGIRINSIAPGFLDTDMTKEMTETKKAQIIRRTPLGRLGDVEDIVGVVRFLLSSEAKFITGHTFVVDGGLTC